MVRFLAAAVVGTAVLVWTLIDVLAVASVQQAVSRDAVNKALHWGGYMSARVPDLQRLIATGVPTDEQMNAIRQIRQVGDVFRFKLFDAQGRLVLISDESFISDPKGIATEFDPEPRQVVDTRIAMVDVYDGTEKPDRPDLYAEAYVPLIDEEGSVYGVVEVYVDETMTRQYFTDSFQSFGVIVSMLSAILFLVPAAGYGMQRSLTQRSRSEAEYLAKFDALTGLLNRAEFTPRAKAMIVEKELSALLFLDADKFKSINDTHGHAVGDSYLEQIGRNLTAATEPTDLIARFGGDEFVVALRATDTETVVRRVRKILTLCSEPLQIDNRTLASSVSIGVSLPEPGTDLDEALAQADAALYHAKSAGRNQYALYDDDMGRVIRRRNLIERRLKGASKRNEFTLEYQPLVSGEDLELVGYEALMRLRLRDGTPISPGEFIPIAEEIGLIDDIGAWVLQEATRTVADLPGTPKVAINLSVAQFRSGRLPELVADALSASGLPADRLELEITESLLLDDDTTIGFQIDALQDMGVWIAMDDFGTGFSSLGYLWKYGFDRIKIDRSFVAGLSDNPERSLEIIETVIMLGRRLGIEVTAEGVETKAQCEMLSKLGCDVLQGFLFGAPAPIADPTESPDGEATSA
ncbi:putative bifunctional diguanylate cyclase/phosphodiesterase [Roseobacter sinensis]|uniref:EAL domain-containing protein n=1 Tax=Roseobacter sinensis TaxID=2931391 RepID=A0ABT3B9J0_9RHOB|nr:GGDEF domain-containing phosphodiesterase [Roseobacter sp. WL0113]MCV3270236.1 EAL domain-containing protein [Roseobacter sp. WL0113]